MTRRSGRAAVCRTVLAWAAALALPAAGMTGAAAAASSASVGNGAPSVTVLVIAPRAAVGSGALSSRLADDLNQQLNARTGIRSILFTPDLPPLREAVRNHLLTSRDLDDANTFDVAEHIGGLLGVRFVVFGDLENSVDDSRSLPGGIVPRLSLARIETSYVTPLVQDRPSTAGAPGADPVDRYAGQMVDVILRQMVTPGAPAPATDPAPGHWTEAQRFLREGHIANALVEMRAAVAAAPDNGHYLESLASLLMSQGRAPEAVTLYQDAATASPFDPDVRIGLARSLLANGDRAAALAAVEGAVPLTSGHPDAQLSVGQLLIAFGEKAKAIQVLQDAVNAGNAAAAAPLAEALEAEGDPAAAEAALRESIQRSPDALAPREQLAAAQVRQAQTRSAVLTLLETIQRSSRLDSFGALVGASAIDAELGAILDALDARPQDNGPLKDRAATVGLLIDALSTPGSSGAAYAHRRAALEDVLQAIQVREKPVVGVVGDAGILIAQARQLLGLKAALPATSDGKAASAPSSPAPSSPAPSSPAPSSPGGADPGQGHAAP